MNRIISSAFVILLTTGAAQAQTTPSSQDHHHKKEHKMAFDDLNLSADQKNRLQSLRVDLKKSMTDLKNNTSLSAEEKQARRKTLQEQFRTQSEAVLTPAQKEQMEKKRSDWKAAHKDRIKNKENRRGKGEGFDKGKRMQEEPGLSQEQQQKISSIQSEFRPKFEALRDDDTLPQEQKKEKLQAMRQQYERRNKN